MKKKKYYIIIGVVVVVLVGLLVFYFFKDQLFLKGSTNTTSSIDMNMNTDDDDEKIDWSKYENVDYELTKSLTITASGVYHLTGTIPDGLITINTSGNVKLVLDNVNITNSSGPAILVLEAEDVIIETTTGSVNSLTDGSSYVGYEVDEIGTIFSHDDLTLQGEGTLIVTSNNEDAIVSKDDLKIVSGTYEISSLDDGIRGKDSVYIQSGTFIIKSQGDGIKSTNDTDTEKGFVYIQDGTFTIESGFDGIQAETKLLIENGSFNITTGGGSGITSTEDNWGFWGPSNNSSSTTSDSAKGLKASDNLLIEDGVFVINSSDDAIHSNNYVGITKGNLTIQSGDDGIHADEELIIDGGEITITKSYEGLEASQITINGGNISVLSSDDGINVAGGNDSSSMNRKGANEFSSNSNNILTINGGTIYVDSSGDGLDANGSIYINGGKTTVDGPTNSGNAALDYDKECVVTGGTFVASGMSGMAQGVSSSSSIYNLFITFQSTYKKGDVVTIVDSSGNEILSYESSKSYNSLVIATPDLKKGNSYTIKVNGSEYTSVTISNVTTTVGNSNGMGNNRR